MHTYVHIHIHTYIFKDNTPTAYTDTGK